MNNQNKMARTIIVGDVHGCLDELSLLLDKCRVTPGDRVILLGDLINKGPFSSGVLKWVKARNYEVILGNHELSFLNQYKTKQLHRNSVELIDQMGDEFDTLLTWIKTWPLFIEEDDFLLVHGGLVPGEHPRDSSPQIVTRIRTWDGTGKELRNVSNPPWYDFYDGKKLVIYGHWAEAGLVIKENAIGLDSGCAYGRQLSACILPGREIIQVQAARQYCPFE